MVVFKGSSDVNITKFQMILGLQNQGIEVKIKMAVHEM